MFVHSINNTIRIQEETERVTEVMSRIIAYNAVDIPSELKDVSGSDMIVRRSVQPKPYKQLS